MKNNSSSLINFTNDQVDAFGNSLFSYISLLAEILVAIGIISILLFFEPRSTLLILSLALIFGLVFFLLVNKKISLLSKKRLENKTLKIKDLQEGFGAIKEIKIYNKSLSLLEYLKYTITLFLKLRLLKILLKDFQGCGLSFYQY